jgi:alanine racemase
VPHRPTTAIVDLDAIAHNVRLAQRHAAGASLCAVVKANAYGHGSIAVARATLMAGAQWLAVALVEEAQALRRAGITAPILVMAGRFAGAYDDIVRDGLTPVVGDPDDVAGLSAAAGPLGLDIHLELDTGMSRLGLLPEALPAFIAALGRHPNVRLAGCMSHFAQGDVRGDAFNGEQVTRLEALEAALEAAGHAPRLRHLLNSPGVLNVPEARRNLVRCGLILYGLQPMVGETYPELRPAMRWVTRPVSLRRIQAGTTVSYGRRFVATRPTCIATLPVGYADGYMRLLGNRAHVLVRGKRAPVVGTVCMDLCMVDVTDIPGVGLGDEVVLLGAQGEERIGAEELAAHVGSIAYEIVCAVGARVPRIYTGEAV